MFYQLLIKNVFDFLISLLLITIISPLIFVIIVALSIVQKTNPFFVQKRPGLNERKIKVIKFKTMSDKRDIHGNLLPDAKRITKIGSFLRKTSLDELPQFINVLKGDMSLIGPRPLLFKYIPLYNERQRKRHLVKPGITGWAQVNGRNSISWGDKFELDVFYVENLSFTLDLKIFYLTILKVINMDGINQTKERPMMPFNGSN